MSTTTFLYIVALVVYLVLLYPLYKQWRSNIRSWKIKKGLLRNLALFSGLVLCVFATLCWLFITYYGYVSWRTALDSSLPKKPFEIYFILFLFVFGFTMFFAQLCNDFASGDLQKEIRRGLF